MPAHPELHAADGVSPAVPLALALQVGETSAPATFYLYNDKNLAFASSTLVGARLRFAVLTGGVELSDGVPLLDRRMIRVTITGMDSAADPTMRPQVSGTIAVGAGEDVVFDDIPPGCARIFTVAVEATAVDTAETLRMRVTDQGNSVKLAAHALVGAGSGVLLGSTQDLRQLVRGRNIIAAGTADLIVERGAFDYDRTRRNVSRETITLNANDSAAAALLAGESYIAALSQAADGTVTVTKGAKGAAPVAPVAPVADILLGTVVVAYQAGGVPLITQGDVDMTGQRFGEFRVVAGAGLSVRVYPGTGIGEDSYQWNDAPVVVPVTASATTYVWMTPTGAPVASATATAPVAGAYPLAVVVADAGAVTGLADVREFVSPALVLEPVVLELRGPVAVAADFAWKPAPFAGVVDHITAEVGSVGAVSGGRWQVDVTLRPPGTNLATPGATLYTSHATDDARPAIAFDAAELRAVSREFEVQDVEEGARLAADVLEVPAGAVAVDLVVTVFLRRR